MKRLLSVLRGQPRRSVTGLRIHEPADLIEAAHWIEPTILRMEVPVGMLRMQGGFSYGERHPFVQALAKGADSLRAFYERCQPKDISEYYGLPSSGRAGEDLPPWELPWYQRKSRLPPPGEADLGAEHGVSFYGPASPEKIAVEMKRLRASVESIRNRSYDPDTYGDIEGYVMRSRNDACFFVRGGKHRTAALAFLGRETIPVCFRGTLPRVVDESQAAWWPLVRSGNMDLDLARDILRAYTNPST